MLLQDLRDKKLIHVPDWLPDNTHYLTIMGSMAYGVSTDTSDMDVYGFCIPPRALVFPHTAGEIPGFGRQLKRFEQYQEHHIKDASALSGHGRSYDFSVFSIVRYFQLCMENNPNMIDSLFTPVTCVLHATRLANRVRDERRHFLHKGAWHTFRGYAYSQLHKMEIKADADEYREIWLFEDQHGIPHAMTHDDLAREVLRREAGSQPEAPETPLGRLTDIELREYGDLWERGRSKTSRFQNVKTAGTDWKFGYHLVRLIMEAEQILTEGDLDLQRHREMLKDIRRGNWTLTQLREWFTRREQELNQLYVASKLPEVPDEKRIKELLLGCLEEHYGSLEECIVREDDALQALRQIQEVVERYNHLFR